MLLRRTLLLVTALVLMALPSAAAQEELETDREAGYLGLSYTFADLEGTSGDYGHGISLRMGFRMARYAALELEGDWISGLGINDDPWNLTVNLKGIYPLGPDDRYQPFLVVGGGIMSFSRAGDTKSNLQGAYRVGGGLDYFVTRNWVAQAVVTFVGGAANKSINYTTVKAGVTYVFR